jgi:hypothetical protein
LEVLRQAIAHFEASAERELRPAPELIPASDLLLAHRTAVLFATRPPIPTSIVNPWAMSATMAQSTTSAAAEPKRRDHSD